MRTLDAAIKLGCVLCLSLGAQAAQAHSPRGKAYHVTVYSSFETQFDDCFSFADDGSLTIAGFGTILYRFDALNTQVDAFQASGGDLGFTLSFHGTTAGADGQTIQANGLSSDGDTYILQGVLDSSCTANTASRAAGSLYRR